MANGYSSFLLFLRASNVFKLIFINFKFQQYQNK